MESRRDHATADDLSLPVWDDRRQRYQRAEDIERVANNWAARLAVHWVKIASLIGATGVALGMFISSASVVGLGLDGVPQKLARVERGSTERDSVLSVRVTRLEEERAATRNDIVATRSEVSDLRVKADLQSFVTCLLVRELRPKLSPPDCQPILNRGAP